MAVVIGIIVMIATAIWAITCGAFLGFTYICSVVCYFAKFIFNRKIRNYKCSGVLCANFSRYNGACKDH